MQTFGHDESGVRIHYDSRYTGPTQLILPLKGLEIEREEYHDRPGEYYLRISGVPCEALAAFGRSATISAVISAVEDLY